MHGRVGETDPESKRFRVRKIFGVGFLSGWESEKSVVINKK